MMLFYCKDCQKVIKDPPKKGNKYEYTCPVCKGDRVSFGTKEAICDFYDVKEKALEEMLNSTKK